MNGEASIPRLKQAKEFLKEVSPKLVIALVQEIWEKDYYRSFGDSIGMWKL